MATESLNHLHLNVDGMHCRACEMRIELDLAELGGVESVAVSYTKGTLDVDYDEARVSTARIAEAVRAAGYTVLTEDSHTGESDGVCEGPESSGGALNVALIVVILIGLYLIVDNTIGFDAFPQVDRNMGYGMLFVVGLLTSLHCVAMCGGIGLAQSVRASAPETSSESPVAQPDPEPDPSWFTRMRPGLLYNLGRVVSYTVVGGIVGALGATLSISTQAKAIVTIAAGVFMVLMGISMLARFEWASALVPRIPKKWRTSLFRRARPNTPFWVGILNGFMPCGPLQAMQLYALATGSLLAGALSMFLFSLGTVPLMLIFATFGSLLRKEWATQLTRVSVALVIILGVVMGNRGLLLAGIDVRTEVLTAFGVEAPYGTPTLARVDGEVQVVTTELESGRYVPIEVYAGIPVRWTVHAAPGTVNGCNNEIHIPSLGVIEPLDEGDNIIEFTPAENGTITYTCWMGMITSSIKVSSL